MSSFLTPPHSPICLKLSVRSSMSLGTAKLSCIAGQAAVPVGGSILFGTRRQTRAHFFTKRFTTITCSTEDQVRISIVRFLSCLALSCQAWRLDPNYLGPSRHCRTITYHIPHPLPLLLQVFFLLLLEESAKPQLDPVDVSLSSKTGQIERKRDPVMYAWYLLL